MQAINDFTLAVFDITGNPIGAFFAGNGSSDESAQEFALMATYIGGKSVQLTVRSVYENELEFREIAFEGIRTAVPEPTTLALMGLGRAGIGV